MLRSKAAKESGDFYAEFRVRHPGQIRALAGRQGVNSVERRLRTLLRGGLYDISDRKALEARLLALNETLEARVAEVREEARALEVLNRTGTAVAAEHDLEKLVQMVTDAGVELSHAEFGAFFYNVIRDDGEAYTLYTLSGAPREAFAQFPMPRNTAIFEPTFRGRGPMRSDDILADARYGKSAPYHGMPKGHLPVRSYLAVPVTSRSGEVLGGLFFGHAQPGVFTERAERIVTGPCSSGRGRDRQRASLSKRASAKSQHERGPSRNCNNSIRISRSVRTRGRGNWPQASPSSKIPSAGSGSWSRALQTTRSSCLIRAVTSSTGIPERHGRKAMPRTKSSAAIFRRSTRRKT